MAHLVGVSDTSSYSTQSPLLNDNLTYYRDFVASASGTATSIGFYWHSDTTANNLKLILCDSSGNHIASGTVASSGSAGWKDATISATITSGVTYRLVVIADGYFYGYTDSATWSLNYGGGTYASPPNPVTNSGQVNGGNLALRVQGDLASVAPTITSFNTTLCHGKTVVATVTNAGSSQGGSTLTVGGATATINSWADTSISFVVPLGAGTGSRNVVLTTSGGSATSSQTVTAPKLRFRNADSTLIKTYSGGSLTTLTGSFDEAKIYTADPVFGGGSLVAGTATISSITAGVGDITQNGSLATGTSYWFEARKTDNSLRASGTVTASES